MSIVLRFIDKNEYVKEYFFCSIHIRDTIASTLKDEIFIVLSQYNLDSSKYPRIEL